MLHTQQFEMTTAVPGIKEETNRHTELNTVHLGDDRYSLRYGKLETATRACYNARKKGVAVQGRVCGPVLDLRQTHQPTIVHREWECSRAEHANSPVSFQFRYERSWTRRFPVWDAPSMGY